MSENDVHKKWTGPKRSGNGMDVHLLEETDWKKARNGRTGDTAIGA
jgi:hypothetical protein